MKGGKCSITRRDLLRITGVAALGSVAGCTGYNPDNVTYAQWQQQRYGGTNSGHNPNAKTSTSSLTVDWEGTPRTTIPADATMFSPVVGDGRVYLAVNDRLIAYNTNDGGLAYEFDLGGEVTGNPVAHSGTITVPVGTDLVQVREESSWSSVNAVDGFRVGHNSPIRGGVTFDHGNFYYQLDDGTLVSTEAEGPTKRWEWDGWPAGDSVRGSPAIVGASVVAPTRNGAGVIREIQDISAEELTHERVISRTDHIIGDQKEDGRGIPATPLLARGQVVYYVDRAGQLIALSVTETAAQNDRGLRWVWPIDATGAPTLHGDTLIVPTKTGIQARRVRDGRQKTEWAGPFQPSEGLSWNQATAGSGVVYAAASDDRIYCLSVNDGSELGSVSVDRPIVGDVVLSGDNLYATPKPGTGEVEQKTATPTESASTDATRSGTPASKTPIGSQLFAVTGELNMAYIRALREDKVELAKAIDGLSMPIEVKLSDRTSAIRDEELVTEILDRTVQQAESGEFDLRTASELINRFRWAESLTKRTLEVVGPTTDVPDSHINSVDDIPLGEYFAYNTGKLTFRSLLEIILFLLNFVKLAKFADEVLGAGDDVLKWGAGKLEKGTSAAKSAKKAGSEGIETGFKLADDAVDAGATKFDEFKGFVDESWRAAKAHYEDFSTAVDAIANEIKLKALKRLPPLLEEAKTALQLKAVGANKLLRTIWDESLGRAGKYIWETLTTRKDATVEATMKGFIRTAEEISAAVDRGRALGGYTKNLSKKVGSGLAKKGKDAAKGVSEGVESRANQVKNAQKRVDQETQQIQEIYNRYQGVKDEAFGEFPEVDIPQLLGANAPMEGFENFIENTIKDRLNEIAGDEQPDPSDPNTLAPTAATTTPTEEPTDNSHSWNTDQLITAGAEAYDAVEDLIIDITEGFTIAASTTFAFMYQEAIEHGEIYFQSPGPFSPLMGASMQKFSLRGALLAGKNDLDKKFENLTRVEGLPNQTQAEEARAIATNQLNNIAEDVVGPLLNVANLDLWEVGEDYPGLRQGMRDQFMLMIETGRQSGGYLRGFLEWLASGIEGFTPLDEDFSASEAAERLMEEIGMEMLFDQSLALSNRVAEVADPISSGAASVSGEDILSGVLKLLKFGITAVLGVVTVSIGAMIGWASMIAMMKTHYEGVQGIMRADPNYRIG